MRNSILALLACVLLISCSITTRRMYEGPDLPRQKVATLTEGDLIQVIGIDDVSVPKKYPGMDIFNFEVLPGEHTLTLRYDPTGGEFIGKTGFHNTYTGMKYKELEKQITAEFQAGKTYLIKLQEISHDEWKPILKEQ